MPKKIIGFSKLSREEKIDWLSEKIFDDSNQVKSILDNYLNSNKDIQAIHDSFSENSISNFYLPYSLSPNFLINNKNYTIPLVTEESSVVAALSNAAKFWFDKGGFKSKVESFTKRGHIHLSFNGDKEALKEFINNNREYILKSTDNITKNMKKRGGGISAINIIDKTSDLKNYFQLSIDFDTSDSMGANFINSCLEAMSKKIDELSKQYDYFIKSGYSINIIMSILSNYTPDCIVEAHAECDIKDLIDIEGIESEEFAKKMKYAFDIAKVDINRAVTHNKGIMNGIDAILIATGNDFRAIEAGIHAYAARDGKYSGLSKAWIKDETFWFELEVPLAVGTVGGLTKLHPMVKWSHELLQHPDAEGLMQIMAVSGLAQNFAALRSLVTTGIQKGHMKMHLLNILNQIGASEDEKQAMVEHFKSNVVSFNAVEQALTAWRKT